MEEKRSETNRSHKARQRNKIKFTGGSIQYEWITTHVNSICIMYQLTGNIVHRQKSNSSD